ncbi:hypothetical protein D3C84_790950 [compost metagenome]
MTQRVLPTAMAPRILSPMPACGLLASGWAMRELCEWIMGGLPVFLCLWVKPWSRNAKDAGVYGCRLERQGSRRFWRVEHRCPVSKWCACGQKRVNS